MPAGRPARAAVLLCSAFLGAGLSAAAQEEGPTVAPDRPDSCNGIQIVPAGHLQVEGGTTVSWSPGGRELTVGELTLRVPLAGRLETRVQLFSADWASGRESARGLLEPLVDVKWKLHHGERTDFGVIAGTSLPVGSGGFRDAHFLPYGALALDEALGESLSVTVNLGLASSFAAGATHGRASGGASFSLQASPKLSVFLEGFAWGSAGREVPGAQLVDGGVQLLLGRRVMLDARAGVDLARGGNGAVAGLGASALF